MADQGKENHLIRDMEIAYSVLLNEGQEPDMRRLKEGIETDRDIMGRMDGLPEEDRIVIDKAIRRLIRIHREELEQILPGNILEKESDCSSLAEILNQYIGINRSFIGKKMLAAFSRTKKSIARDVVHPQVKNRIDQDINSLIDDNAEKSLEEIIEIVLSYLRERVLDKKARNISFYLVDEKNQYEQIDSLTLVSPGIISTPMSRREFDQGREHLEMLGEKDHLHGNRVIEDYAHNKLYLELNIKGLDLGVLQIDMHPGKRLNEIELEYLTHAASRLDSKIDEAMRTKRLALIAREAHRILDAHGTAEDFEAGLAEFMVYVCRYSTAYEAEVFVDIYGDGEDFYARNFNDDGDVTPIDIDESIKSEVKIPTASRKIDDKKVLISDIVDAAGPGPENIIGKVYFKTNRDADELRNEDRTLLTFCAEILHSHILAWRKHLQLRIEGVDPQIARTTMRGGVKETVKEIITALYTDISGFTYICELVEDALRDYPEAMDDVELFKAVLIEFLNLVQQSGHSYGGVWDKAGGDMGLMEWGIPIDKNGMDPLGDGTIERHPEYFALNALKASLLIRSKLDTVTLKFREHLLKLACKKYLPGTIPENLSAEDQCRLLEKLRDETGLTPKISTTTSVYTGISGYAKLPLGAASDWTGFGNTMNTAARYQASSGIMETRLPLLTRDLVWPLIKSDRSVPINNKGKTEKFSDFLRNGLGMNPDLVEVEFRESYEGFRNKSGRSAVFTLMVRERNPEIDRIKQNSTLPAARLLEFEGMEFAIENRSIANDRKQQFFLKTVNEDPEKTISFRAIIPPEAIEERVVRYTSPRSLSLMRQNGIVKSLMVQDGRIREFTWKSIEEDQDELLSALAEQMRKTKETLVVYNKLIPGGCYILSSREPAESDAYEILTIEKNNYTFKVRVSKSKIHEGPGPILEDLNALYDFQSYYDCIKGQTAPDKPVIFVHKRHFYNVTPAEAETFILPIMAHTPTARQTTGMP